MTENEDQILAAAYCERIEGKARALRRSIGISAKTAKECIAEIREGLSRVEQLTKNDKEDRGEGPF